MLGKQRSPFGVIVLSIFTLGIYWLVWTRRAFGELAENRGRTLPVLFWQITVGLYMLSLLLGGLQVSREVARLGDEDPNAADPDFEDIMFASVEDQFSPLGIAAMVVMVILYLSQLRYLREANELVLGSVQPLQITAPSTTLVIAFSLLVMVGAVFPFVGAMIGLAGHIIAIVWVVQVQNALNEFWRRIPYVPSVPPPQGIPAPIMMPRR